MMLSSKWISVAASLALMGGIASVGASAASKKPVTKTVTHKFDPFGLRSTTTKVIAPVRLVAVTSVRPPYRPPPRTPYRPAPRKPI